MNDIVAGDRSADDARKYYAHEFLNVRRKEAAPYMERLRFQTGDNTADADERTISDQDLKAATEEGERKEDANRQ